MAAHHPNPPTDVRINRVTATKDMSTRDIGEILINAVVSDSIAAHKTRLVIWVSSDGFKSHTPMHSDLGDNKWRAEIAMTKLAPNTRYQVRLWTKDNGGVLSKQYTSASFWTNRNPVAEAVNPQENTEFLQGQEILFSWKFTDPDEGDSQTGYQIAYKRTPRSGEQLPTQHWTYLPGKDEWEDGKPGKNWFLRVQNPVKGGIFKANCNYVWQVRVRDERKKPSEWTAGQSFFIRGGSTAPNLLTPVNKNALIATRNNIFTWKFLDPDHNAKQRQADIRWRVVNSAAVADESDANWVVLLGADLGGPGPDTQWELAAGTFQAGFQYEWQVRTYANVGEETASEWSTSALFNATVEPGYLNKIAQIVEDDTLTDVTGNLGCGSHRVFIYMQGGQIPVGEITPLAHIQWSRLRDDISNALITTNGWDVDCGVLLGQLRSWTHEVVIFRDNDRVFEGPITRITYTATDVEIEAKDVMAYLYRRIMRQGYNDRYQRVDLTPKTKPEPAPSTKGGPYTITGRNTVVQRALQITLNALAYKDPNVLGYVTTFDYPETDTKEQRQVYDYQKSAWEEIDDMAANNGLDYTTVGRRIMYWDVHRPIGRLPEMRDGDFQDPVIVTEYGMEFSNYYAVTNNAGAYGAAYPAGLNSSNWANGYGPVEMVSSQYGENEAASANTESLNAAARTKLEQDLREQATKGIAHRYPVPIVARIPDNSRLNPDVAVTIQQLVPGVWIPLRATLTCRQVSQWQKLDSVTVIQEAGVETVQVTMSPAPSLGDDDPDMSAMADT